MREIIDYAERLGWHYDGLTKENHLRFLWTDDTGIRHTVITGNPRQFSKRSRTTKNYKNWFTQCMRGNCQHAELHRKRLVS